VLVVGYMRVSGTAQVEDGLGLDIQEEGIRRYCEREAHELLAIHADEAVKGTLAERNGLTAVLAALEFGMAEAVVVHRLDRLARDLLIQETIVDRLHQHGRRVLSATEDDIDGEDPTRVLVRQVLGAIAQFDRARIVARMQAGRAAKAAHGGFAGYGSPAYGWRTTDRELVIDLDEQAVLRRIAELHRAGLSLRQIGRTLDAERLPPKRAERWQPAVLGRLVKRLDVEGAGVASLVEPVQRRGRAEGAAGKG
jgi:DNA invertase Pin-like site-specific DNA recombinase